MHARLASASAVFADWVPTPAWNVCIMMAKLKWSYTLCRALKTKHETPKYGLIYHASLIGQAPPKFKGKISRDLAANCALSIRVDALGEAADAEIGLEARAKVRALQPQGQTRAYQAWKPWLAEGSPSRAWFPHHHRS